MLKMPIIQARIKTNLSTSIVATEFSHTILHRQNVFDAAKNPPTANRDQTPTSTPSGAHARNASPKPNVSYLPQPRPAVLHNNHAPFQAIKDQMAKG